MITWSEVMNIVEKPGFAIKATPRQPPLYAVLQVKAGLTCEAESEAG